MVKHRLRKRTIVIYGIAYETNAERDALDSLEFKSTIKTFPGIKNALERGYREGSHFVCSWIIFLER